MSKRNIGKVLWLALQYAKEYQEGIADAWGGDETTDAVKKANADIKAFSSLQIKLFGTDKTELQTMMKKMKPVSIMRMFQNDFDPDNPFDTVSNRRK
jgi:hypothetical protein